MRHWYSQYMHVVCRETQTVSNNKQEKNANGMRNRKKCKDIHNERMHTTRSLQLSKKNWRLRHATPAKILSDSNQTNEFEYTNTDYSWSTYTR